MRLKKSGVVLVLCLFLFGSRVRADSASAFLNFGSATFSGSVSPSPNNVGYGGVLSGDGTVTQAYGFESANNDTFSLDDSNTVASFRGNEQGIVGWGNAASNLQIGPTNFSIAKTTSSKLTAISSITGNDLLGSQADRLGVIADTNGKIDIKIPYSIDLDTTNDPNGFCCYSVASVVYISFPELPITAQYAYAQFAHTSAFGEDYHHKGILSLDVDGVQPGNYFFDIGVASSAVFVPEPSTLFLLGTSLFGITVGTLLWKKFE